MDLESEFTVVLHSSYEAARDRGYVATYFLQMLEEYGGIETAKRLLAVSQPQAGLFKMWELHLLDESVEAAVLKERFRSLFADSELAEARRRLNELGYFKKS